MNREQVLQNILSLSNPNILIELPTSYGKSKIAIELMKKRKAKTVLIVVPKIVLKDNWRKEVAKWFPQCNSNIEYCCYDSLEKYKGEWDMAIFDECHHLTERCRDILDNYVVKSSILLSATVSIDLKYEFDQTFSRLAKFRVSIKDAIENNVLPDPRVVLLRLELNNTIPTETIIYNKGKTRMVDLTWNDRWTAKKQKNITFRVFCTERNYYSEMSSKIEWYKGRRAIPFMKNKWQRECGERLKWLSRKKLPLVRELLQKLNSYRTLTFCGSIDQTEELSSNCIHSKNKESETVLSDFNEGRINHIAACNMLNEGMNLVNCRVGIYVNLSSSETIIKQRLGRLLRHKEPVLIIPYYGNTREEELVNKMMKDYNPDLVTEVTSIEEIVI